MFVAPGPRSPTPEELEYGYALLAGEGQGSLPLFLSGHNKQTPTPAILSFIFQDILPLQSEHPAPADRPPFEESDLRARFVARFGPGQPQERLARARANDRSVIKREVECGWRRSWLGELLKTTTDHRGCLLYLPELQPRIAVLFFLPMESLPTAEAADKLWTRFTDHDIWLEPRMNIWKVLERVKSYEGYRQLQEGVNGKKPGGRVVGVGGCSTVLEAVLDGDESGYVAKRVRTEGSQRQMLSAVQRWEDELLRLRQLKDHFPGAFICFAAGHGFLWEEQGYCWSLFTFHPRMRGTVQQLRRAQFGRPQDRPRFLAAVKQIVTQVLRTLAQLDPVSTFGILHPRIMHGDIKPANIMYSLVEVAGVMRLVIKVIDWGDAIELPPRQAAAGAQGQQPAAAAAAAPAPAVPAVLTMHYAAPEMARSQWRLASGRADVWSLAVTALELLRQPTEPDQRFQEFKYMRDAEIQAVVNGEIAAALQTAGGHVNFFQTFFKHALRVNLDERKCASTLVGMTSHL